MFLVDTNVLVYAANRNAPEHHACRSLVERCRNSALPWRVTWGVLYEFLRVVTHPRVFETPWSVTEAWAFVEALCASPSLRVLSETERHQEVLSEVLREVPAVAGNFLHDVHTAAIMREHGVGRIYTRDTGFHRFPFVEAIDPLTASRS